MPENRLNAADDLVVVEYLRKTYGATVAVDDVSLTVRAGEIHADRRDRKGGLRRRPPASPLRFAVAAVLYSGCQLSIGLLIAAFVSTGRAAGIVGNISFFPSMFFAGVWTPGDLMPESLRWLRDITPMGAGMSGMQDAWTGAWPGVAHTVAMLTVTVLCVGLAARFFRWE